MPGLPDIIQALQTGGLPQGNLAQSAPPILAGLGAQQDFLAALPPDLLRLLPLLLQPQRPSPPLPQGNPLNAPTRPNPPA
jgi:hypothetical protein